MAKISDRIARIMVKINEAGSLTPEQEIEATIQYFKEKSLEKPWTRNYTEEQRLNYAIAGAYNNWVFKLPLPDSQKNTHLIDEALLLQIKDLLVELKVDSESLNVALEQIYTHLSCENPAHTEIYRLTRAVLIELMKRYGYSLAYLAT